MLSDRSRWVRPGAGCPGENLDALGIAAPSDGEVREFEVVFAFGVLVVGGAGVEGEGLLDELAGIFRQIGNAG